jgi:type 2 lantibiotic biosynthesis protein LanM
MLGDDLAGIAAAASTLAERLAGSVVPCRFDGEGAIVERRLDRWRHVVAKGDGALFARRLAWDGLGLERVRPLLGVVRQEDGVPLPAWAQTLADVVRAAGAGKIEHPERFLDAGDPLPFEDVLLPFVLVGRQRLEQQAWLTYIQFEPQAHASLERHLLRRLAYFAARALALEFAVAHDQRRSHLDRLLAQTDEVPGRGEYEHFVADMLGDLPALFRQYPVLARLLARTTDLWIAATREMLERLAQDRHAVERMAPADRDEVGAVVAIDAGLSDPHRGGRSVAVLTFSSGFKVVYKPKDVGTEQAFSELLAWLNERGAPLAFKVPHVLPRSDYGWVEHVAQLPCTTTDEAHRFYRRAGLLLSLVYALAGTDCHHENLVASGEHLVLVDVETLLHHRPRLYPEAGGAWELARGQLEESVLSTGLLPHWQTADGQARAYDVSALHTASGDEPLIQAPRWQHVNTDRMELGAGPLKLPLPTSQPFLGKVPLRLEDYAADLLHGFDEGYRFLLAQRAALLAPGSPLYCLGREPARLIHRNTRAYGWLHQALRDPASLRDGADWSIELDRLARSMVQLAAQDEQPPCWWPLIADEQIQMSEGDIPYFSALADEVTVTLSSGQPVEGCIRTSGLERVVERLTGLGDADLSRQRAFVAGALYSRIAPPAVTTPAAREAPSVRPKSRAASSDEGSADTLAMEIAAQLAATAIRGADRSATWIGPQYLPDIDRYQLQPIAFDLNTGACGIAVFLAALEHATGGAGYRDLALGAMTRLRTALRENGEGLAEEVGVGGATGMGSVVYSLARVGQWLDDPAVLSDARLAARLIDDERIVRAPDDVFLGTAGAALALLTLYEVTSSTDALQRATACGNRLLQTRAVGEPGRRTWMTLAGRPLTGFSHGAAGIAYALLRLAVSTGRAEYRDAAAEAITYEDELFDPGVGNWPDLRGRAQPSFATSWCHGAPGIGLARLGGLVALDTAQVRTDIDAAVRTTLGLEMGPLDHVCCGNLGRLDLLLEAGERLGRDDLLHAARERGQVIAHRAQSSAGFGLDGALPPQVASPGFFQGLAGVGYQLLRITRPGTLPSVLLWH